MRGYAATKPGKYDGRSVRGGDRASAVHSGAPETLIPADERGAAQPKLLGKLSRQVRELPVDADEQQLALQGLKFLARLMRSMTSKTLAPYWSQSIISAGWAARTG